MMPSEAEILVNSAPAKNFWGEMPEEDKSYFETPNGNLFTQSFLPLDGEVKGTVYMSHGYGSDTSWMFQKICMNFATWGYAIFAADLLGHGRSDGIRCYVGDLEKVAATSLSFFKHVLCSDPYKHLPAFLFGESMGGLATLLMYFQSEPDIWTGMIFSARLFVIPEDMKPNTWAAMPDNKMAGKAIHDPEKLKIIVSNPNRYTEKPRMGTMREILRKTQYVQENFGRVTILLLTVHGTADGVTCPSSSKLLYEKASSADKTMKLYDGMYHSLIQGEPDENAENVLKDMREWIDERVKSLCDRENALKPPLLASCTSNVYVLSSYNSCPLYTYKFKKDVQHPLMYKPFGSIALINLYATKESHEGKSTLLKAYCGIEKAYI
ncbi:unnamed protein product [Eruca vesicaria subsp. sativa]|uniref:Serine aminopeptidase S33 domain-containing protein n=1 Tax=Eruca vesicaria subsp. sativa TaxID=29727 RepID=A0ABC8K6M9_ERUVS|nr:unnamed protein product [Eruca vesicaria subsp. sativa]